MTVYRVVDLTREVRTPAGVAYFHKPIGTPIGGGSSRVAEAVKAVEPEFHEHRRRARAGSVQRQRENRVKRTTYKPVDKSGVVSQRSVLRSAPLPPSADGTGTASAHTYSPGSFAPVRPKAGGDFQVGKADNYPSAQGESEPSEYQFRSSVDLDPSHMSKAEFDHITTPPNRHAFRQGKTYKVKLDDFGRPSLEEAGDNETLTHVEAKQVSKVMLDASTPDDVVEALKNATEAHRADMIRFVMHQHNAAKQFIAAHEKELKGPAWKQVLNNLVHIVPWMRSTMHQLRTGDAADKLREKDYLADSLDHVWEVIVKTGAMSLLATSLGAVGLVGAHLLIGG